MWDKIVRYQAGFSSAVLSVVDEDGFPASWRVNATIDRAAGLVRMEVPPAADLRAGPASLLFHAHDERLWNLRSFNLKGRADTTAAGWVLVPKKVIPGVAVEGPMGYVRFLQNGQKATRRFFEKRGQPVPAIDWDALLAFMAME